MLAGRRGARLRSACAHCPAGSPLQLIIGAEFRCERGPAAGAAGARTARLRADLPAHHPRAAARHQGQLPLAADRTSRSGLDACLALWLPPAGDQRRSSAARHAAPRDTGCASASRSAPGWRWNCIAAPAMTRAWRAAWNWRRGAACRRWRPATCTCIGAAARRLQDLADRDPPWLHGGARPASDCSPTASGICARCRRSRGCIRRSCWPRASPSPSAAVSTSASCATNIRPSWCPPAAAPREHLRALSEAGARQRWPRACRRAWPRCSRRNCS